MAHSPAPGFSERETAGLSSTVAFQMDGQLEALLSDVGWVPPSSRPDTVYTPNSGCDCHSALPSSALACMPAGTRDALATECAP